ncbi:glycosyltransferase family 4 protein [Leeuwenhoekiella parthenopeia]|uniref:Glycosyltransferase family 4 protein n=1 Tax=Leeuwenhoekiella parthenopeia TaxID=2890320 RepID=A0ABS8H0C2_9FLAO|nr:glycosyltransferase family 4 protein [Leeuwenhoekiella parthenopeia]MCC4214253.1 glycosyltransferase family 4 protein [Leeuwenhoekiella parthenopeia]
MNNTKRVCIVVNGKFHAFDYAYELQQRGLLFKLISTMPFSVARKYGIKRRNYVGLPVLELLKRFSRVVFKKELNPTIYSRLFNFCANVFVPKNVDVLIGFAGFSKEIFKKNNHTLKILDRGSTHAVANNQLRSEAAKYHNEVFKANPKSFLEREFDEYELADYILIPSDFVAQTFTNNGIDKEKLLIIPYGFSHAKFELTISNKNRKRNVVLFVGQLSARKGVGVLIDAFSKLYEENDSIELWLVGAKTNGFSYDLNKPFIKYFGVLRRQELLDKYLTASIFCLPSFEEGLALVLTEANYLGLPIIATRNTGIENLVDIDDENYVLFEQGNATELALKIDKMLKKESSDFNPALRKSDSSFEWEKYVDQLINLLEK